MPYYKADVCDTVFEIETPTGDYARAAVIASAMADASLPCDVKIWCEHLLPTYGPYWYRVRSDECGRLVVAALIEKQ